MKLPQPVCRGLWCSAHVTGSEVEAKSKALTQAIPPPLDPMRSGKCVVEKSDRTGGCGDWSSHTATRVDSLSSASPLKGEGCGDHGIEVSGIDERDRQSLRR